MRKIRKGVFETNSSSTHSITICNKDDYDKWIKDSNLLFNANTYGKFTNEPTFITKEQFKKLCPDCDDNCFEDFFTSDEYDNAFGEYEQYEKTYKTPNGEEIIAFGYYGHD